MSKKSYKIEGYFIEDNGSKTYANKDKGEHTCCRDQYKK